MSETWAAQKDEIMTEKLIEKTNLNSLPKMQTVGEALGPDFFTRALTARLSPLSEPPVVSPELRQGIRDGIKEMIREVVREILAEEKAREAEQNGK